MTDRVETQLYLIAPPLNGTNAAEKLALALDTGTIACARLVHTESEPATAWIEATRKTCHAHDVALVVEAPDGLAVSLAETFDLDGVHIASSPKAVAHARRVLGKTAIVGVNAGISHHDGMNAAEAGADYVAFGPIAGDEPVDPDLLDWWAQVIETPQVVEGGITLEKAKSLVGLVDFIVVDPEIWESDDPAEALKGWAALL